MLGRRRIELDLLLFVGDLTFSILCVDVGREEVGLNFLNLKVSKETAELERVRLLEVLKFRLEFIPLISDCRFPSPS